MNNVIAALEPEQREAIERLEWFASACAKPRSDDDEQFSDYINGKQDDAAQDIRTLLALLTRLQSLVDEAAGVLEITIGDLEQSLRFPEGWECTEDELLGHARSTLSRLRAQPNTTKPAMDREPEGEGT